MVHIRWRPGQDIRAFVVFVTSAPRSIGRSCYRWTRCQMASGWCPQSELWQPEQLSVHVLQFRASIISCIMGVVTGFMIAVVVIARVWSPWNSAWTADNSEGKCIRIGHEYMDKTAMEYISTKSASLPIYFPGFCCDLITLFTIFASSTKNARKILQTTSEWFRCQDTAEEPTRITHRDFTQSPHLEPPYARRTVFWRLEMVAYCRGRRAGI